MEQRVVVSGIGVISSIGVGRDAFWQALLAGKSGISEISSFDSSMYPTHNGGEVKNFHPEEFIPPETAQSMGRASYFGVIASGLAIKDAGLNLSSQNRERIGVVMGTTMAETQVFEKLNTSWINNGLDAVEANLIGRVPAYMISANVGRYFDLGGVNFTIPTACAAGNYCIGYGFDLIKKGSADIILAGGSDAFSQIAFTGFNRLLAIAPEKVQPFDKNRKGMMVGEGSAMLILESLESALKRKTEIYAEVLGYGLSCDAHHMTAPHAAGIARAIVKALKNTHLDISQVDYINAHGTGTPANDREECLAIKQIFNDHAKNLAVSSIKSMLGHTMGAASAIEAAACSLAVKYDSLPPTINYETPDPECDIDCIPNTFRKKTTRIALNNSSAFGGNNACVVFGKFVL